MPKVYRFGKYVDMDPSWFDKPHENVTCTVNGRRTLFTLCHYRSDGMLVGYSSRNKKWATIVGDKFLWFSEGDYL